MKIPFIVLVLIFNCFLSRGQDYSIPTLTELPKDIAQTKVDLNGNWNFDVSPKPRLLDKSQPWRNSKYLSMPDGRCIGPDGNLWVAHLGGLGIYKWHIETGELLGKI